MALQLSQPLPGLLHFRVTWSSVLLEVEGLMVINYCLLNSRHNEFNVDV